MVSKGVGGEAPELVLDPDFVPSSRDVRLVGAPGALAAMPALATAACGGGGSSSSPIAVPSPTPTQPTQGISASQRSVARTLLRVTFGISPGLVDEVEKEGVAVWLDRQMRTANDSTSVDFFSSRKLDQIDTNAHFWNELNFDSMIWSQLITEGNQVRKRMALALSQIFVVSMVGLNLLWRPQALGAYWDILNKFAFGQFRDLLEAVTLSPAMGAYLNMRGSQASDPITGRVPDENFAREILQLFSIGLVELNVDGSPKLRDGLPIETYTNEDVEGLAKVFTGWDLDYSGITEHPSPVPGPAVPDVQLVRRSLTSDPSRWRQQPSRSTHSLEEKRFLGTVIPAGTGPIESLRRALDVIAAHPNVGPFISKQLIQRFVTSNPSPAYVARIAAIFNDNGRGVRGDLGAVFRSIILDVEANDASTVQNPFFGKLREPMVRFAQWGRAFNAKSKSGKWSIRDLSPEYLINQSPLRSPSVFNFYRPGYVLPRSQAMANNMVSPEFQIANETSVANYVNFISRTIENRAYWYEDVEADYGYYLSIADNSIKLLDTLDLVLTGGQLGEFARSTILNVIQSTAITPSNDQSERLRRVQQAATLVMCSSEYLVQK